MIELDGWTYTRVHENTMFGGMYRHGGFSIACPVCDHEHLHVAGAPYYEDTRFARYATVLVPMYCEGAEHYFEHVVGSHEGDVYLGMRYKHKGSWVINRWESD